ncbi:MAG: hypothetical protein ABIJ56_11380, partial [Pseudomonadota bacterium]
SSREDNANYAWHVNFNNGNVVYHNKDSDSYVRCVRWSGSWTVKLVIRSFGPLVLLPERSEGRINIFRASHPDYN